MGAMEPRPAPSSVRPTLRDVAAAAHVSFKTVARVVNGEPGVRPETAARVMDAVALLGFHPNQLASSLKRGVGLATVGLVIEDVANPFFAGLARVIEEITRARGMLLVIASSDEDPARERQVLDSLVRRRVNGLLVVPAARDHRYLAREMDLGMPVVFLDRPPGHLRADAVLGDDRAGAQAGVEHLVVRGHRRIAAIGDSLDVYTMRERRAGYHAALEAAGLPVDPRLERFDCHDTADAECAVRQLLALADPPTAVFGCNNRATVGAVQALVRAEPPVALMGFDDFELAGALATPVSVVVRDNDLLARTAAELLLRRMDGWRGPTQRVVVPFRLITRGSGELPPRHGPSAS